MGAAEGDSGACRQKQASSVLTSHGQGDGSLTLTCDSPQEAEARSAGGPLELGGDGPWTDDSEESSEGPSELYGKFTWKIENFNDITKRELRSSVFEVGSYKWYILIYPHGCDVCDHLSLFLCVADYDKLLPGWSHFAQFTIAVVNRDPKKSKYSDTLHRFCKKEHDWGWKKFMELNKVHDGFTVANTLVIKAQVQVIQEKHHRPFRCLDSQYRRELVRVYLSNVEGICRRFLEERREQLQKLREEAASFSSFWSSISASVCERLTHDRADIVMRDIVKRFFNEKEVTSTLVMDALYCGARQLDRGAEADPSTSGTISGVVGFNVAKNICYLRGDAVDVLEEVVHHLRLEPSDAPSEKEKEKDKEIEESTKDSVDKDERRLAELGKKTVEMFAVSHLFFSRIEQAYREALALKRQEALIKEEEEAETAKANGQTKRKSRARGKRSHHKPQQQQQQQKAQEQQDSSKQPNDEADDESVQQTEEGAVDDYDADDSIGLEGSSEQIPASGMLREEPSSETEVLSASTGTTEAATDRQHRSNDADSQHDSALSTDSAGASVRRNERSPNVANADSREPYSGTETTQPPPVAPAGKSHQQQQQQPSHSEGKGSQQEQTRRGGRRGRRAKDRKPMDDREEHVVSSGGGAEVGGNATREHAVPEFAKRYIGELNQRIEELEKQVAMKDAELNALQQEVNGLKADISSKQKTMSAKDKEISRLKKALTDMQQASTHAQSSANAAPASSSGKLSQQNSLEGVGKPSANGGKPSQPPGFDASVGATSGSFSSAKHSWSNGGAAVSSASSNSSNGSNGGSAYANGANGAGGSSATNAETSSYRAAASQKARPAQAFPPAPSEDAAPRTPNAAAAVNGLSTSPHPAHVLGGTSDVQQSQHSPPHIDVARPAQRTGYALPRGMSLTAELEEVASDEGMPSQVMSGIESLLDE